jgi:hypothetical protein
MSDQVDLLSSVKNKGNTVTQIITYLGGYKKTFRGVISSKIEQGEFTHLELLDGRLVLVNTKNVLNVEIFKENG